MSSGQLRTSVRELLHNFVVNQEEDGQYVAADVLRMLHEESHLLYETQCIKDLLDQDPFQCYGEDAKLRRLIGRFQNSLQVTSCHRLDQADNYCLQQATVRCNAIAAAAKNSSPLHKRQKRQEQQKQAVIQLFFRYERTPATETTSTSIWYSIDFSRDYGPQQNMVTIRVWADGNKPSKTPAKSMDEGDDEGLWEDMDGDDDDEDEVVPMRQPGKEPKKSNDDKKNKKVGSNSGDNEEDNSEDNNQEDDEEDDEKDEEEEEEEENPADRYAAFVDPDVLLAFQEATQLTVLDQATAFFTLMTFPYYQHEWDLVGFVLDSVFGYNDEEGEEDGDGEDE